MKLVNIGLLGCALFFMAQCSHQPEKFSELLKRLDSLPGKQKQEKLRIFTAQHNFPFVEDSVVYFLTEDTTGQPVHLAGDITGWRPDSIALKQIAGTNFWYTSLILPAQARIEYKFVCGQDWRLDPFNPLKDGGGFGENSVLVMPDYRFPQEVLFKPEFQKSTLDTFKFKSKILNNRRYIYFYKHERAGNNSPLIIFQDGGDYLTYGRARIILDNLIGMGRLEPLMAVFVEPRNRKREYRFNDLYLKMLFKELLPWLKQKFKLRNNRLALGGASLGGLISLYALKKYGSYLDFVFSQSGALWIDNERIIKEVQAFRPIKTFLFLSYGLFENMDESHQKLERLLENKGINFEMKIYYEGHNWGNWRAHLKEALLPFAGGKVQ